MKIGIMESLAVSKEYLDNLKKPFEEKGHTFVEFEKTTDIPTLKEEVKDLDVMMLANMPMPNEVIDSAEQLKFIDVAFTGVDHVGLDSAKKKNIAVSNASGYSNEAVPELVVGMVISFLRNIRQVEDRCRQGKTKDGLVGSEVKGKTVGIIGLGNLGRRSAEIFHCLGANIITYTRTPSKNNLDYVTNVTFEEVMKQSDILILHCPLTDETRNMINKDNLKLMKNTALLVNVARGPVVNSQDLADALNNDEIAGACIDVFDIEPPLSLDDPLLNAKNTLVTPHVAFATKESMNIRADIVFDNLDSWLNGDQKNTII